MTTKKSVVPLWLARTLSFVLLGSILVVGFMHKGTTDQATVTERRMLAFPGVLHIADATVATAFAVTPEEQEQGLSNTAPLAEDHGMLFVFDTAVMPRFWMKDMSYALDIIWIDENKIVVDLSLNLAPDTFPTDFSPIVPVRYVLEVPAGFAEKHHVVRGVPVSF